MNLLNATQIFGIEKPSRGELGEPECYNHREEVIGLVHNKGRIKKIKKRLRNFNPSFKEGRWTAEEHNKFVKSCLIYGNNWKKVQKDVKTRTSAQIRSHAQKFVIRLCRKYSLRISKRGNTSIGMKKSKLPCKSFEEMEEEDRKILEMFNCFRKTSIFTEIDEYWSNTDENSRKNMEDQKEKKKEKLIYTSPKPITPPPQIMKKLAKKKHIFKIEKTDKQIFEPLWWMKEDYLLELLEFEKIKSQLYNMIDSNDKMLSSLLNFNSLEENKQILFSWLKENQNFSESSYFTDLEHSSFINEMNALLSKWN